MSTILSQRNITVQKSIKEVEDNEDMRNFLKSLRSTYEYQYSTITRLSSSRSNDVFIRFWYQLSDLDRFQKFINSYNIPDNCECNVQQGYICIEHAHKHYTILHLSPGPENSNIYVLTLSGVFNTGKNKINLDKMISVLRQLDGVEESGLSTSLPSSGYEVFQFLINFNRL